MRVFISHSNSDDDFVTKLATSLQAAKVDAWVDHMALRPGHSWSRAIQQALGECDTMIVVLSAASVASEEVEAEWIHFLREKKRVVPIMIDHCELPYRLGVLQYVNFTAGYETALRRLLQALGITLNAAPADAPQPAAPDVPAPIADSYAEDFAAIRYALRNQSWKHADEIAVGLIRRSTGREKIDSDEAARAIPDELLRELHALWAEHGLDIKDCEWVCNYLGGLTTYVALFSFNTYLKRRFEELGL